MTVLQNLNHVNLDQVERLHALVLTEPEIWTVLEQWVVGEDDDSQEAIDSLPDFAYQPVDRDLILAGWLSLVLPVTHGRYFGRAWNRGTVRLTPRGYEMALQATGCFDVHPRWHFALPWLICGRDCGCEYTPLDEECGS